MQFTVLFSTPSRGAHRFTNQDETRPRWNIAQMARQKASRTSPSLATQLSLQAYTKSLQKICSKFLTIDYASKLLFDPAKLGIVTVFILLAELIVNVFVVQSVRYTEIDWLAYMQECEGFLNGTTNYAELKGKKPANWEYNLVLGLKNRTELPVRLTYLILHGCHLSSCFLINR